jgi:hypothetical protein
MRESRGILQSPSTSRQSGSAGKPAAAGDAAVASQETPLSASARVLRTRAFSLPSRQFIGPLPCKSRPLLIDSGRTSDLTLVI